MGNIKGPFELSEWLTMKMLREDNQNMTALSADKHSLAIKCNNNCLREFYRKEAA